MTDRTTEEILSGGASLPPVEPEDEFAVQIADQVESFLIALKAVAVEGNPGTGISLLLLEISQLLLAGARLGAQIDFTPTTDYQPDVGPDPDLDELRLRLAQLFGGVDTYSFVFDPYDAEQVESLLSDDLTQVAADLENGLRHFNLGNTAEASWTGSRPPTRCSRKLPRSRPEVRRGAVFGSLCDKLAYRRRSGAGA
jgi:hypothetical protein